MNVAKAAYDQELFANRRAELYWGIRERFHEGAIAIPNDEQLIQELASIRYFITSNLLQICFACHRRNARLLLAGFSGRASPMPMTMAQAIGTVTTVPMTASRKNAPTSARRVVMMTPTCYSACESLF